MESLLARYLDGELDEVEARRLVDALGDDPALEARLRDYEALAAAVGDLPSPPPPDPEGFTDRVMSQIGGRVSGRRAAFGETRGADRFRPWLRWQPALASAAGLAILFGAGYFTARLGGSSAAPNRPTPTLVAAAATPGATPAAWNAASPAVDGLRAVRLVYAPSGPGVSRVTVAGSFNDWNPEALPLHHEGKLYSIVLLLPPGSYEYMFVENGHTWVTDPLASQTREDGFGGKNAVLDLQT